MQRIGIWLLVLGGLTFIYPLFNMELRILSFFDPETQSMIGIVMLILGAILTIVPVFQKKNTVNTPESGKSQSTELPNTQEPLE